MTFPSNITTLMIKRALACTLLLLPSALVGNPVVNKGELKINNNGTYVHDGDPAVDNGYGTELEVMYGFSDALGLGFELNGARDPGDSLDYSRTSLFARYQFLEADDGWWWEAALDAKVGFPKDTDEAYRGQLSLLLQNDSHNMRHRAYITWSRRFGEGQSRGRGLSVRWWSRYKATDWFEPGVEYVVDFSDMLHPGPYDDQEQYLGPVISGDLSFLNNWLGHTWEYEVGHLFGLTSSASDAETRWKFEVKIQF